MLAKEREEVVQAGLEVYERGLVAGTWGNISSRLEKDREKFAITPSGMDYREVEKSDIVILNLNGEKVEGDKKPSSEKKLHIHIYKSRDDINSIVHSHSIYASAIAVARRDIPPIIEDMVQIVGGNVETADYKLPGTDDLAEAALDALSNKKAALLANHGVVALGEDMKEALKVA
ncbi:aldolase, partial [candidate division MSBL1 archaeon SCGC-AAA382M17]